jgi:phosphoribosyl 1,2-cyclic phosphodiesterase
MDHCSQVKELKNYYNGKYYANDVVQDVLPILDSQKYILNEMEKVEVGSFTILPFEVYHDTKNFNFLIKHNPSGMKILHITDTSSISNLEFKDVDIFVVEANHSWQWLMEMEEYNYKESRSFGEEGHMAIEDTIDFLNNNINHNTKQIVLIHLSSVIENHLDFENKVKTELFVKYKDSINVTAINPKLSNPLEIILKKELEGYNFE